MPRISAGLLLVAVLSRSAFAQQSLPEAKLKELKEATVFVKTDTSRVHATGSGFLILKDGDTGYVATNAHVVEAPAGANRAVTVVFLSGTKDEYSVTATPVGEDADRDLAILRVQRAGLPKPLSLSAKAKLVETLPVFILGFPFGEALATSEKSPAITIGRGSVSSLRNGDDGEIAIVQIDGDINHGNSGGPIVDSSGALVGITVAKVEGTGIGFAIPPRELDGMLAGRVISVDFSERSNGAGSIKLEATVKLIDPLGKCKGVSVLFVPKAKANPVGKPDKNCWPRIGPDALEFQLKVQGSVAKGEVSLKGEPGSRVEYLQQPRFLGADSKPVFLQPSDFVADFSGAPAAVKPEKPGDTKPPGDSGGDWLGGGDKPGADKPVAEKPSASGKNLAGNRRTILDATATEIALNSKDVLPCLFWSSDGKFLFATERNGTLRKISWPGLDEDRSLSTGGTCAWAGLTKEGVLVIVDSIQEGWLLDAGTLEIRRKFPVAASRRFASSPASSYAFFQRERDNLDAFDLRSGKLAKTYVDRDVAAQAQKIRKHKEGVVLSDFNFPTLTPDGKYLFCIGFECMHRFKVDGANLVYEEMGPRLGNNPQGIRISSDSKYVCMLSGGGNSNPSDHPKAGGYSTYIYKVSDLLQPVMFIASGAYPRTLDFDKSTGLIYAQNYECTLMTFGAKGAKEKEYALKTGETSQMLSHPSGSKAIALTEAKLWAIELGSTNAPVVGGANAPQPVKPEVTPPAANAGAFLDMPDALQPAARLALRASVPALHLSPDGEFLFALDMSEGRVLKIRASDLGIAASAEVSADCAAMAVSAKGDRLYVAARGARAQSQGDNPRWKGRLTVFDAALAKQGEFEFDGDPYDLAVTNSGLVLVVAYSDASASLLIDTARKVPPVKIGSSPTHGFVRTHPDQARFYFGTLASSPRDFGALYLTGDANTPNPDLPSVRYSNRGRQEFGGPFVISPDGSLLFGSHGAVLRIGAAPDSGFQPAGVTEPWLGAANAAGWDNMFVSTAEGFVKSISMSTLATLKAVKPGGVISALALDAKKRMLYGVVIDIKPGTATFPEYPVRTWLAGDIVAWPLEKK